MSFFKHTYTKLPYEFYSKQNVYSYPNAKLLLLNKNLLANLEIDLTSFSEQEVLDLLLGHNSDKPISQAYAGHQFGHFTILGDGRATLIGEFEKSDGSLVDFHLKGAGLTKYSRGGDGKATLGSMLREYIMGEAIYNLGIPTSRILAVILTGEKIQRNTLEQGAIAVRVASSHIRVGTFQYAALQGKKQIQELLDYTITRHSIPVSNDNKALSLLEYVIEKQSDLIINWERVGFIHGVMNTDNMTISGETIDYGPCAFMDTYDPETVFSFIDRDGRYAFANQSSIAAWNIARLAESLLPLISQDEKQAIELAQDRLKQYFEIYENKRQKMFLNKLGLNNELEKNTKLVTQLLTQMYRAKLDYTNTFYDITYQNLENAALRDWRDKYLLEDINYSIMKQNNPIIIPRNHQVERAIKAAENNDLEKLYSLLEVLENPYSLSKQSKDYMAGPQADEKVKFTFCGT